MKKLITIILALIMTLITAPKKCADQPHVTAVETLQAAIATQVEQVPEESKKPAEILLERKKTAMSERIFPNIYRPEEAKYPEYPYNRMKTLPKQAGLPVVRSFLCF